MLLVSSKPRASAASSIKGVLNRDRNHRSKCGLKKRAAPLFKKGVTEEINRMEDITYLKMKVFLRTISAMNFDVTMRVAS